jgi:hypothetical protein
MSKKQRKAKLSESQDMIQALGSGNRFRLIELINGTPLAKVEFMNSLAFGNTQFITPDAVADILLARVETRGPVAAVDEIEAALLGNRVPAIQVMAVCGLGCSDVVEMGDVRIMPINKLDPSLRRNVGPDLGLPIITAIVRPVLTPVSTDGNGRHGDKEWLNWRSEMIDGSDDILNRLAIASRGSGVCHYIWHARDIRDPWFERNEITTNGIHQSNGSNLGGAVTEEVARVAASYRDDQIRANRLALNRYRRACTTTNFEEAAIEIAIAFEALLMRGENDGELSLKVRLRAAHLLADNLVDRKRIHDVIKNMYSARSKLVHNGGISMGEIELRNQNYEAIELFPAAAEKLLNRDPMGHEDWTRLLLGGPLNS